MFWFVVYAERGPFKRKNNKNMPSIGRYKNIQIRINPWIRCRQKWRQNFRFSTFVKGFEIDFSKSVLFRVSQKIPFTDLSKSKNCRHFLLDIQEMIQKMYFLLSSRFALRGPKARPPQGPKARSLTINLQNIIYKTINLQCYLIIYHL